MTFSPAAARLPAGLSGLAGRLALSRRDLFAGTFLLLFLNGLVNQALQVVGQEGLVSALGATFGVSAVVWMAAVAAVLLCLRAGEEAPSARDALVATAGSLFALSPSSHLSWLGLTFTAAYLLLTSARGAPIRRGAAVFLAITVPMFWGRRIFSIFAEPMLQVDAALVSLATGLERVGNTLQLDEGGYMWIADGCSSVANMSLAFLCWISFTAYLDRGGRRRSLLWCSLACVAVIAVNVGRMSLIGLHPDSYDLLHGAAGASVANWLTSGLVVAICAWGTRRHVQG